MFNWKFIDEIFLYDGTFEGLLTIVFDVYISKKIPYKILPEKDYIANILDKTTIVVTDYQKFDRVFNGIAQNISTEVLQNAYNAFLSSNKNNICENKEIEIVKYILYGFIVGPKVITMLSVDYVLNVYKLKRNVLGEAHRLKGLVRFIQIGNNLFYSSIHPDNNVIENIGNHFIRRFPTQSFILHDKNRNIAMLYNQKEYTIIDVPSNFSIKNFSDEEQQFQNLWKTFFNTISIKERQNPRLQMQYMPKKYWNDLIEKIE